ncbi:MAG: hypothetical protein QW203_06775 [Thermoplasmatales archaeon]
METLNKKNYEKLSSYPIESFPLTVRISGAEIIPTKLGEQLVLYRDADGKPPLVTSSQRLIRQVRTWQDKFREIALAEIVINKKPAVYEEKPTYVYSFDNYVKVLKYKKPEEKMVFKWNI